jgi:hypothetical protein
MNSRRLMPIMASIKVTGAANRRHSIRLRLDDEAGHTVLDHLTIDRTTIFDSRYSDRSPSGAGAHTRPFPIGADVFSASPCVFSETIQLQ